MSIQEIKSSLPIQRVLDEYGLKPNRNDMLHCPFHDDRSASMKIYHVTNTAYCFAGGCEVESVDVIDFIMKKEKCGKHEAIQKAKSLCGHQMSSPKPSTHQNKCIMSKDKLVETFRRYHKSLHGHRPAQEYCEERRLDWEQLEIGYKSRYTKGSWGKDCLIFPLVDEEGNINGLYGRSINKNLSTLQGRHYYQSDRSGLYPGYPLKNVKVLLLTESVIDAATLLPLNVGLEDYAVLSLYGTNGLTNEHLKAIKRLAELEEVVFCFDGDEAGRKAMGAHAMTLGRLKGNIRMSYLKILEGEDVNSLAVGHEEYKDLFVKLVRERIKLGGDWSKAEEPKQEVYNKLDTSDPGNLVYLTSIARYYIKGGVRTSAKDLQHLKITLVVENDKGRKSRNGLDLYEDRQVEKVAAHIAERLGLRADLVELDLHALADELEIYRKEILNGEGKKEEKKVSIPKDKRSKILAFWKRPDVFKQIDRLLELLGIVGEENNRRLGFCIVSSPRMPEPLHGLIQGSSGSGKTHLLSVLCSIIPEEWYIPITRATDNTFYNYGKYELSNKLISIEDKDALSDDANLSFRELQSKGMVSQSTTGQDESGYNRSYVKEVYGPIASLSCTTKGSMYLDDMNRCFLLAIDESEEQTRRVLDYLKRSAAGKINKKKQEEAKLFLQDALRMLHAYEVVIPQAPKLSLPPGVRDERRLNSLYLKLVKQITLLHQYQRTKDQAGRLIATKNDLKLANEIMFDAIVLKVDDLHGPLRSFYEKLKRYLMGIAGDQASKYIFRQREIRQGLHLSRSSLARFVKELLEMEYVHVVGGSEHKGLTYQISYWDDNEALRQRIKKHLYDQIAKLIS